MKNDEDKPALMASDLRCLADEGLKSWKMEDRGQRPFPDNSRFLCELQAPLIEGDSRNEELSPSRTEVEVGLESYTVLYDFAPVGYLTLDREGVIRQANLTGARLLGVERPQLVNCRFELFVLEADRPLFDAFLKQAFESKTKQVLELALLKEEASSLWVQIEALASEDRQECRAVLVDITERKKAEKAIKEQMDELRRWHEVTLGRETRILDLKREVNELLVKAGRPPRYESAMMD